MARTATPSVRFYTRHKKQPPQFWKPLAFQIIVSYDKKRLTIPGDNYTPYIGGDDFDVFSQLNSDGTPKDPHTTDERVLSLSTGLQESRKYYEAALKILIDNGLWRDMDAKKFCSFLFLHEEDIRALLDPMQKTWKPLNGFKEHYGVKSLKAKGGKK